MAKSKLNQFDLQVEQEKLQNLQAQSAEYRKASAFIREWNKLNQQAKRDTADQLKAAKEIQTKYAGFTKELKAQTELVAEIGNLYDDQVKQQKKILNNFDDLDDTFTSIISKSGKNNKLTDALNLKYDAVRNTVNSISDVLEGQNELSEHQIDNIVEATNKYKTFQSILAEGKGNKTQQEYNDLIKQSYEEFDELFHKIDDSSKAGQALKERLAEARVEMESFNNAAAKSSKTLQGMDFAMDQFNGVPMMSEFGKVIKEATSGGAGLVMALAALGAAAGALAYNLGLVGDKVGTIAKWDRQLADVGGQIDIINQKVSMGLFGGTNFVAAKAMNQFVGQMKQMAAQFQAASKTALFGAGLGSVGYGADKLQLAGISAEQIADSMTAASDATGKMPSSKVAADMAVMAARTGQSGESIAAINDAFQRMDGVSAGTALNLQEGLRTMAKQANINLGGLMTEMADASKEMLGYQIKSGTALARQITYARSLGVSFGDIAKAGQSMVLNYKDSIKSEMQLSAMLGKNVDLSQVRASFASGDTEGALKALKAQGLNPADMDMFQQQQLSQATGMSLTDLQKISTRGGANVGGLGQGNAKAGNETFLSTKSSAEMGLQISQAMISANTQLAETLLNSKEEQAKQTALMENTGGIKDLTNKMAQLEFGKQAEVAAATGGYSLLGGGAGAGLALLVNKLMGNGGGLFSKTATAAAEGGAEGGTSILSKVGGKTLGGITAAGIEGYMEYQDNKSKGISTGENVARTAQVATGAGLGAWGGAAAGAALGTAIFPVVGTAIGGLIGGALGAWGGSAAGKAAGNAEFGDKSKIATAAAAATPGNTSVTTTAVNSNKWMQDKLTYMSGNLERVVDRTTKSMLATQQSSKDIKIMSANTIAIMNLTKNIEALTAATYEGSTTAVKLSLDGKVVAKSYTKYKDNTNASDPNAKK